jgi:hypothetical protein
MNLHAEAIRAGGITSTLIDAALANQHIRGFLRDLTPPRLWTVEGIQRSPPCRVEWEQAFVIGGIGESFAAARHKNWGRFMGVQPLRPDDPVHWCRILYVYKASSLYNRRFEQRQTLKRVLGRQGRSLVNRAARSTKRDFLARLSDLDAQAIKRRLHLEPGQFWRAAKGRDLLNLPKPPVQLLLFAEGDEAEGSDASGPRIVRKP